MLAIYLKVGRISASISTEFPVKFNAELVITIHF